MTNNALVFDAVVTDFPTRNVYVPKDIANAANTDPKRVRRMMRRHGYGVGSGARYELTRVEFLTFVGQLLGVDAASIELATAPKPTEAPKPKRKRAPRKPKAATPATGE